MGRVKKNKPRKRRAWELTELQQELSRFSRDSLWQLLAAAGRSPGVRHRWASVTHLIAATTGLTIHGDEHAAAADLPLLLELAHRDEPQLPQLEDFMPEDPRDDVQVEFNGRLYRIFGGNIERPIADLDRLIIISAAVDDALMTVHGFGLQHLAEVVLQHVDDVVRHAANTWPPEDATDFDDVDVRLDAAELIPEPATPVWSGPHAAALEWATRDASSLSYDPHGGISTFGTVFRVRFPDEDEPRWLPLELAPEALGHATVELAREVVSDPLVRFRFAQLTAARVRRRLWKFSRVVMGPPDMDSGPAVSPHNVAQWAVQFGARDVVAVQIHYALDGVGSIPQKPAVVEAAEATARGAGTELRFAVGTLKLKPGARVIPVIVHASSGHVVASGPPGTLQLSMEDLDWMASSANDEAEFFHFASEMTDPDLPEMFGLETINVWDWWQDNGGALHRSGRPPSLMVFEAHRGTVEWKRARRLTPMEQALHTLGMPPVRAWDVFDEHSSGPTNLMAWSTPTDDDDTGSNPWDHVAPEATFTSVHLSPVPVAFMAPPRGSLDDTEARLIIDIAGAFGFALDAVDDQWAEVARTTGIVALGVTLEPGTDAQSSAFVAAVHEVTDGRVSATISIDFHRLGEEADGDATAGRRLMAAVFRELLELCGAGPSATRQLADAWEAAPPTLTVHMYESVIHRNHLRPAIAIEGPLVAAIDRRIARRVSESGTRPGVYAPEVAKDIDRSTLAPAVMQILRERLAEFNADDLILLGMVQLERILSNREDQLRDVHQSAAALDVKWDPVLRQAEIESEFLRLRRCVELVVEAALLFQPAGDVPLDDRSWATVIAAAAGYLDATTRSEGLHYQVTRTGLEVNDMYDLDVVEWPRDPDAPPTIDYPAYTRELAEENLHQTMLEPDDSPELESLLETADALFRTGEGATVFDLTVALVGLSAWPLDDGDADVVAVSEEDIVADLLERTVAGQEPDGRDRMTRAVRMLRSSAADYSEDDWVPWRLRSRRVRLITRPLTELSDGRLVVAPHLCHTVGRIYQGYWRSGQLPWTQPGSTGLEAALDAVRHHRNIELERQVRVLLDEAGWTTVARIKPGDGRRIGVRSVSTEIDIVAGRADSDVIWVLEVKDPVPVFAPSDFRRQLNRFFDGPKSYASQLSRKLDDVAVDVDKVAAKLDLPTNRTYRAESLFVTRRVVPAAFADGEHQFTTAAKLVAVVEPHASAVGGMTSFDAEEA